MTNGAPSSGDVSSQTSLVPTFQFIIDTTIGVDETLVRIRELKKNSYVYLTNQFKGSEIPPL